MFAPIRSPVTYEQFARNFYLFPCYSNWSSIEFAITAIYCSWNSRIWNLPGAFVLLSGSDSLDCFLFVALDCLCFACVVLLCILSERQVFSLLFKLVIANLVCMCICTLPNSETEKFAIFRFQTGYHLSLSFSVLYLLLETCSVTST